jgi:cell division protein FtsA
MSLLRQGLTPRLKPLAAKKATTVSVLDIGTHKIACLIAELHPVPPTDVLRGRTHIARVIGIGHHKAEGMKGGAVIDLEAAENAIRHTLHAAERMARAEVESVIVSLTGGRLASRHFEGAVAVHGTVKPHDVHNALSVASEQVVSPGRTVLHTMPVGYAIDSQRGVLDPSGMMASNLGVDMHVVTADLAAARNLMLAVERCHVGIEAVVAAPYASGLAVLTDDEAEMGVTVIDMGAGTTSVGVFSNGHLVHIDAFAMGGNHITADLARGLSTRMSAAERLKTLYGSTLAMSTDDRDRVAVPQIDEDDRETQVHVPKAQLNRIIAPRVEEMLELVRDRLKHAGFPPQGRRIVLTGGASQLMGVSDVARKILTQNSGQVRIGRPLGIRGLPDAAKGPGFAAAVGLLVYPQVAHLEHFEPRTHVSNASYKATGTDGGYFSKVGRWLKESF